MAKIVGVKFKNNGKVYYFDPTGNEYKEDENVIVETVRGIEYGKIVIESKEVADTEITQPLKPIIRVATKADDLALKRNEERKPEALKIAEEKIAKHNLVMKLIDCEFTFDGSKVIFYFTADGRIDFRELVRDLASAFRIRIELRQVGIRDEAKILGGVAPCGRACCCSAFLNDFKKVSIKMAKTQNLSLNPGKISGLCGRLMCCLEYENEHYAETVKLMPKIGSEVSVKEGNGIVLFNNLLKRIVRVRVEHSDGSLVINDYPISEVRFKKKMAEEIDESVSDDLKDILD